jgi:hypothetical protein
MIGGQKAGQPNDAAVKLTADQKEVISECRQLEILSAHAMAMIKKLSQIPKETVLPAGDNAVIGDRLGCAKAGGRAA